jgi:fatty-acyl-CoA synthase
VELEAAIVSHPDVVEAAVIGVPHPKWDERPLALVVARPGASVDAAALTEHLRERVAKWWIPETFELVDAIPRTAVGKIDKKLLRSRYAEDAGSAA